MKRLLFAITIVFFTILSFVNFSYAVNRILALDGEGDYVDLPNSTLGNWNQYISGYEAGGYFSVRK